MRYPSVIGDYMRAAPWSVEADESLYSAERSMEEHGIRELPVREHGRLCGVVTDRDVQLAARRGGEHGNATVRAIMSTDFYPVRPTAPLAHVVKTMAAHDYQCAVVVNRDGVSGVFTTAHALRALSELLEQQAPTRDPLGPGEVRAVILTEHSHVSTLLERARATVSSALSSDATQRDLHELRTAMEHLLMAMSSHLELEDRALAPALAALPGYGRERAEQLVQEHHRQRADAQDMVQALAEPEEPAPVLAHKIDDLLTRLEAGLIHEEELLLNLDLLRDDTIVTECTAG